MRKKYRRQVKQYAKQNRHRSAWHKLVQFMACVVVFCTTYALILPAITLEQSYSCGLEAHTHGEECYQLVSGQTLSCTAGEDPDHTHTDECYVETAVQTLVCSLPEHIHEAACQSDPEADLETEEDWTAALNHITLTGDWSRDLAAVAETQIGYRESEKNYQVDAGGNLRGYSRYGAWYGVPYGKWDAMFAAFCMHYAGIPQDALPFDSNTGDWFDSLMAAGLIRLRGEAVPDMGDLVFFTGESGAVTRVAIVTGTEGTEKLRLVEGDSGGRVMEHLVPANGEGAPLGFVSMSNLQNPAASATETEPPETTVPVEATDPTETTGPSDPTEPSETTDPTEITEPTEPDETTKPDLSGQDPAQQMDAIGQGSVETMAQSNVDALSYTFVTANPSQLQEGVDYVIYTGSGGNYHFLRSNLGNINASSTATWSPYNAGGTWTMTASAMTTGKLSDIAWRVVKSGSQIYLVSQSGGQRLIINNGSISLGSSGTLMTVSPTGSGAGAHVGGSRYLRYDNGWTGTRQGWWSTDPSTVYFAQITPSYPNHPPAVETGDVHINRLRFFNICENGEGDVSALAGCVFEIKGDNGYIATVTSGNEPEVKLPPDIPDGNYTITEIATPDGYIRDTEHTRSFVIRDGALAADNTIGTFINHNMEQIEAGKTGQVVDYENRIYQVDITADSHMRMYEMEPMDLLFVVDQSNSMLFPAGLKDIGKRVTLRRNGNGNVAAMDALNLDKSKMHYIIADPKGTSTVWAVWHDGTAWLCQDASYYAKAKFNNDPGYQDDNEIVIFPSDLSYADQITAEDAIDTKYRSNGCGLGRDLGSSSLGKYIGDGANGMEFVVYQATSEYNRLHHLEESLANLIYEMADVNDKNRITLTRFSRTVDEEHCIGPWELTPENTKKLVDAVTSIKTSGGTRQDRALEHVYTKHLNDPADQYKDFDHSYTLLITDGAPVRSGDDEPSGGPGTAKDPPDKNGNTIYSRIKAHAQDVRTKSHLMTVALGMDDVEAGRQVLEEIASDGSYYCSLDDAADLLQFVQKLLFESFKPQEEIEMWGDVVDEISDSFYPIAWTNRGSGSASGRKLLHTDNRRDWVLLNTGDWITLEGKLTTAGAADAAGQLLQRDDGTYYVQWTNQRFSGPGWKGTVYLKAKEDFIGGNAIATNKKATVSMHGKDIELESPTVNVRLLDLNEFSSEVTVYLGDLVNGDGSSPIDVLQEYYRNIRFTKLIDDGGDVLNKVNAADADGLEPDVFYLRYAIGRDLTADEWVALMEGQTLTFPYTYDDPSSDGPVGEFTITLTRAGPAGENSHFFAEHEAAAACQPGGHPLSENCTHPAETYTLNVVYTAYRLNQQGRPEANVHNGPNGPGTQVGTGPTVPTGVGTVDSVNVHQVHVISGAIEIHKIIEEDLISTEDQLYEFTLRRLEDGWSETKTITVPRGKTQGRNSIRFDNLPRGTYTVTEAVSELYALKQIQVTTDTNCGSDPPIGGSGTEVTFYMGNNPSGMNVIGTKSPADRFTSYVDPYNGVYGEAVFTNGEKVYEGEIPVEKVWDDGAEHHTSEAVYLLLLRDGIPVLDEQGYARLLRLDAASDWKGVFTVTLANKDDSVSNYNYSVREVAQVREEESLDWYGAILENDGQTLLYYDRALEDGRLFTLNGKGYMVDYTTGEDGTHRVTNYRAVELPETGGMGTAPIYTFGGLLVLASACVTGYDRRRKRRREAVE